jgi:hypothetical protein
MNSPITRRASSIVANLQPLLSTALAESPVNRRASPASSDKLCRHLVNL